MSSQKNKMTQCQLPAGCKESANAEWWYHAPGDIDSENLAPLIHLCKKHIQSYLDQDYPPPKFISLRQQDKECEKRHYNFCPHCGNKL